MKNRIFKTALVIGSLCSSAMTFAYDSMDVSYKFQKEEGCGFRYFFSAKKSGFTINECVPNAIHYAFKEYGKPSNYFYVKKDENNFELLKIDLTSDGKLSLDKSLDKKWLNSLYAWVLEDGRYYDAYWGFDHYYFSKTYTGPKNISKSVNSYWSFRDGIAVVKQDNGLYSYLREDGSYIADPMNAEEVLTVSSTDEFTNGYAKFVKNGKVGILSKDGTYFIKPNFENVSYPKEIKNFGKLVRVFWNKKQGIVKDYIDQRDYLLAPSFDDIKVCEDSFIVRNGDRFGFMNVAGKETTKQIFSQAECPINGKARVVVPVNELETDKKVHTNSYEAIYDVNTKEIAPIFYGKVFDKNAKPTIEDVKPLKDFFKVTISE